MPIPKLLTCGELADKLGVSRQFVYDHTARHQPRIPHIRIGGALRFDEAKVEQWLRMLEEVSHA